MQPNDNSMTITGGIPRRPDVVFWRGDYRLVSDGLRLFAECEGRDATDKPVWRPTSIEPVLRAFLGAIVEEIQSGRLTGLRGVLLGSSAERR